MAESGGTGSVRFWVLYYLCSTSSLEDWFIKTTCRQQRLEANLLTVSRDYALSYLLLLYSLTKVISGHLWRHAFLHTCMEGNKKAGMNSFLTAMKKDWAGLSLFQFYSRSYHEDQDQTQFLCAVNPEKFIEHTVEYPQQRSTKARQQHAHTTPLALGHKTLSLMLPQHSYAYYLYPPVSAHTTPLRYPGNTTAGVVLRVNAWDTKDERDRRLDGKDAIRKQLKVDLSVVIFGSKISNNQ